MSRRRYLSTNISTDKRVAQLGQDAGVVAVLLYTWCIPHASDDGTLSADPEELLAQVAPTLAMRQLIVLPDVERFVAAVLELGLMERKDERLRFPASPFYKYQPYIGAERRPADPGPVPSGRRRKSAQNGAKEQNAPEPAQKSASFKLKSSLRESPNGDLSRSEPSNDEEADQAAGQAEPSEPVDQIYAEYKAKIQPLSRLCPRKKIAARLRRFTVAELLAGIDNFASDAWWMSNNANRGAAWFFDSDDQAERFLLMRAPPARPLAFVNGFHEPDPSPPLPPDHTGIRRMSHG